MGRGVRGFWLVPMLWITCQSSPFGAGFETVAARTVGESAEFRRQLLQDGFLWPLKTWVQKSSNKELLFIGELHGLSPWSLWDELLRELRLTHPTANLCVGLEYPSRFNPRQWLQLMEQMVSQGADQELLNRAQFLKRILRLSDELNYKQITYDHAWFGLRELSEGDRHRLMIRNINSHLIECDIFIAILGKNHFSSMVDPNSVLASSFNKHSHRVTRVNLLDSCDGAPHPYWAWTRVCAGELLVMPYKPVVFYHSQQISDIPLFPLDSQELRWGDFDCTLLFSSLITIPTGS